MPELPEVENVVRRIRPYVWGAEIIGLMCSTEGKPPSVSPDRVAGQTITHIGRIGKYIIFKLNDGYLISHLRMTGQWFFTSKDMPAPNADKHFRWGFGIKDLEGNFCGYLWFKDPRKFGTLEWVPTLLESKSLNKLGPDGLSLRDKKVTYHVATSAARTRKPIKNFLLDQQYFTGCGNIYACLDPRCQIFMADGTKRPVNKVQVGEQVLSRNFDTGLIEPKKVVAVSAVDRDGRDLYRIKPVGSIGSLKCTEDHQVYTDKGWVKAKDLIPGEHRIAVPSETPNRSLEQLILGTSLGDSTFGSSEVGSRQSKCLRMYQGEEQLSYLEFKRRAMGEIIVSDIAKMPRKEKYKTEKEKPVYQVSTRYRPYFYTLWEVSKQRNGITKSILDKLNIEGLAYWYLDDGYSQKRPPRKTYAFLCCEGRTREEAILVSNRLHEMGYSNKVVKGNKGPQVRFDHDSSQQLFRDIAPYTPNAMRYKLEGVVSSFKPPEFFWRDSFVFLPFSKEKYDFSVKTVWDLQVQDNHNFISDSVLVHNCEVLFESKVNPFTPARNFDITEVEAILCNLYDIFMRAIDLGGSSISDYEGGLYHEVLKVYGRDGEACFECATKIERAKQAGRSTFFCPKCQGVEENELF